MNVGNYQGGQPLRTHSAAKRGFNLFMPVKLHSAQISEQSDQGHIIIIIIIIVYWNPSRSLKG